MSILDFFKKGKKTKEVGFVVENLNDLEEFKNDDVIYTSCKKEEPKKEEVVLKATKKLPIEELKEKVIELENKVVTKEYVDKLIEENGSNENSLTKDKSKNIISIVAALSLLGTISIGYLSYNNFSQMDENLIKLDNSIKSVKVESSNQTSTPIDETKIKELLDKIVALENTNKTLSKDFEDLKTKKEESKGITKEEMLKTIAEFAKFKEIDDKLIAMSADGKDKKIADIMKKYEEANMLMTEVVKKQREEIVSLNQKMTELVQESKEKISLTKDDLNKFAMLETRVLKDGDIIDSLNKQVSKINDELNNRKLNILSETKSLDNSNLSSQVEKEINKSKVTDSKKNLPIFSIYKILNGGQFYLKNRVNGKLLEQPISEKDVIINRYEVLNVDYENKVIIFKDHETGTSLTLAENE